MTRLLLVLLSVCTTFATQAQTAENIIDNYYEVTGGKKSFAKIQQMTFKGVAAQTMGGQRMEFPYVQMMKAPAKSRLDITFQGQTMTQQCFNGKEGWGINFMSQKPEKFDAEQNALMAAETDFPDALLHYKKNGYKVKLEGEEEVDGTACHKVKLTKKPVMIDGEPKENISYYFFDKESGVLLMSRSYGMSGEMEGMSTELLYSDYQEHDGMYFPFTMTQMMDGQAFLEITVELIDLATPIEDAVFEFPATAASEE